MSLDRKDVRFKLDPNTHAGLAVLADVDQLDIAEWVERVVTQEVKRRVHAATVVAERAARLGISGSGRE